MYIFRYVERYIYILYNWGLQAIYAATLHRPTDKVKIWLIFESTMAALFEKRPSANPSEGAHSSASFFSSLATALAWARISRVALTWAPIGDSKRTRYLFQQTCENQSCHNFHEYWQFNFAKMQDQRSPIQTDPAFHPFGPSALDTCSFRGAHFQKKVVNIQKQNPSWTLSPILTFTYRYFFSDMDCVI